MEYEFYKMRIEAVLNAAKRSRWVFAASTVASLAQIGATWNLYLSWIRFIIIYGDDKFQGEGMVKELQIELLKEWVDSTFVSIPLIGIHLTVADASIVGSFALTILTSWFFFSMRRENHLIGLLLRDVKFEKEDEKRAFVFHGILGTQMFATLTNRDVPFTNIDEDATQFRHLPSNRFVTRVLFFLPVFAIAFTVIFDFFSVFWMPSIFRMPHVPLFELFDDVIKHKRILIEIMLRVLWGSMLAVISAVLIRRVDRFQNGTINMLKSVEKWGKVRKIIESSGDNHTK